MRDEDSYDWSKYNIAADYKNKTKKNETKEKIKHRVKDLSKGTGFVKEEHKFNADKKAYVTLNIEEADNLQDMINYAASINHSQESKNIKPIESLYTQALSQVNDHNNNYYTNEKADSKIAEILKK